jgi:putative transposase
LQLDNNNHSVFLLHYHLILAVKYRRKVIDATISTRLREIFERIAPSYNIAIQEWNHDLD